MTSILRHLRKMSSAPPKPTLLYVGHPIAHAHAQWKTFQSHFNILSYTTRLSKPDLITAFRPGGPYAHISGIIRPNNSSTDLPRFDAALAAALPPSCKIISSANHGYDGEDTAALAARGVWYCNGAGGADASTADTALFLIIAAFRYTSFCENVLRTTRRGDFFSVEREAVDVARNPGGHVLGIVGLGQIGRAVAERARAIGMRIHYYGRRRKGEDVERALGGAVYHGDLEGMLKVADCVLLACPHTAETHHLLNRETFAVMKRGVRVVNIGRGKCVDEEALADAIDEGIVAGAGLDVYHDEYVSSLRSRGCALLTRDTIYRPTINPRLLDNWKITLLPHIGGGSIDTKAVGSPFFPWVYFHHLTFPRTSNALQWKTSRLCF